MRRWLPLLVAGASLLAACSDGAALTVYSGRSEDLVAPLIQQFEAGRGIEVEVRYAESAELAATLLLEGSRSPADVFFAQDPASLGQVADGGLLAPLPPDLLGAVEAPFRDSAGRWVGTSGRARVVVYNTDQVGAEDLPTSLDDLVGPEWRGRVGVAPTNGSFLAFVAAMILVEGEDRALAWLEALAANQPVDFPSNAPIVAAVDAGEVALGLVNHYYLLRLEAEQGETAAANLVLPGGGPGSLVMPAGAGIVADTPRRAAAEEFIRFLLSRSAQEYFATETFEYPLAAGVAADPRLLPLDQIDTPDLDLSSLAAALERATDLVAAAGLL